MTKTVLVVNTGSSSVKFSLFESEKLNVLLKGKIEKLRFAPHIIIKNSQGVILYDDSWQPVSDETNHEIAFKHLINWLGQNIDEDSLLAVGHRVVHGGPKLSEPTLIDKDVLISLESLVPLMPLHQPHNLMAIREISRFYPNLRQVACFDTAFHRGHPKVADSFGLPREYYSDGIRRYGFHGISYDYITNTLKSTTPHIANGRVIIAHLGSGASLCAVKQGKSIDSTMSFSALDGLPMGTRCGNLDPGVILYLIREKGMTVDKVEELLYKHSGLRGMSGVSNDMRQLLNSDDPRAAEAIDYFVYCICKNLAAMTAALGGLDALIFTAGIGENSPDIRAKVCERASWLGIRYDRTANTNGSDCISKPDSNISVWVIPTNEELMIATQTVERIRSLH